MSQPLPDIVATIDIDVPADVVWAYLVEEKHVPRWLGCLEYRKRLGHVFYMQPDADRRAAGSTEGATHCEVLQLDEPRVFAFSWYLPGTPSTTVTLSLEEQGTGTRVTLSHTGWEKFDADALRAVWTALAGGWESAVLPSLRRVATEGAAEARP